MVTVFFSFLVFFLFCLWKWWCYFSLRFSLPGREVRMLFCLSSALSGILPPLHCIRFLCFFSRQKRKWGASWKTEATWAPFWSICVAVLVQFYSFTLSLLFLFLLFVLWSWVLFLLLFFLFFLVHMCISFQFYSLYTFYFLLFNALFHLLFGSCLFFII